MTHVSNNTNARCNATLRWTSLLNDNNNLNMSRSHRHVSRKRRRDSRDGSLLRLGSIYETLEQERLRRVFIDVLECMREAKYRRIGIRSTSTSTSTSTRETGRHVEAVDSDDDDCDYEEGVEDEEEEEEEDEVAEDEDEEEEAEGVEEGDDGEHDDGEHDDGGKVEETRSETAIKVDQSHSIINRQCRLVEKFPLPDGRSKFVLYTKNIETHTCEDHQTDDGCLDESSLCVICKTNPKDTIHLPCMHTSACVSCVGQMMSRYTDTAKIVKNDCHLLCLICRAPWDVIAKTYR